MEARQYVHRVRTHDEEYGVRESSQQCPSNFSVDDCVSFSLAPDLRQAGFKRPQELET